MLFNSFNFFVFYPIVTIIYFLLPYKFRWIHLLLASCIFYCFFIPVYILILLVTILIDYFAGIRIQQAKGKTKKRWLLFSILSTCLVLIIFKYFNFFNTNFGLLASFLHLNYPKSVLNIILPIGLSFHTFQSLSYVIEVYRGNQKAESHFGIYSLYVMFYPQLVAGPIERPQNILHQFYEHHDFNYDNIVEGLKKIVWGLFKKVVVADRLAIYVNAVYSNHERHNGTTLLIASILFAFQIYCDFSGYSDIAIGCARTMGFKLMNNFNRPYFSKSVAEFWKRWHISLSTWFRDYVYIPLGGNRTTKLKTFYNLFVTFALSGLWHGANFTYILWGALNGIYLMAAQFLGTPFKNIGDLFKQGKLVTGLKNIVVIILTFILIDISWILFRSPDVKSGFSIIHKILFISGPIFQDRKTFIFSVTFLILLLIVELFEEYKLFNNFSFFNNKNIYLRRFSYVLIVMIILAFGVFGNSQFIYFQF